MAVLMKWPLAGAIVLALAPTVVATASAATLDPTLLPRVRAATFEVVAAKADESKVVYEKSLPLDEIPFQERTDKYQSLGTAFAIGDGRFVTAGHVFFEGIDSLTGPLALRNEQGHVFTIDKVVRFSPQEDFVEFTLVDAPKVLPLEPERKPAQNESVFAVGNALGTGVVLRDGLYTSDTPEEEQGRWKWMRFSAPASPGNSGGPLVDEKGKVIGVVLRKSPNENLNFALPIARVLDASDKEATIDSRDHYKPPYSSEMYSGRVRGTIPLPMAVAAFNTRVAQIMNAATSEAADAWHAAHGATLFPAGTGSHELLVRSPWSGSLPALVAQGSNGTWVREEPRATHTATADKGYINQSMAGGSMVWHIHSEADKPGLNAGGRAVMEQLLQLGNVTRTIGEDKIKIRSLGDPLSSETFTDRQGRTWHTDAFAMPFLNVDIVVTSTPMPDGASGMLRFTPARFKTESSAQARSMADLLDIAYHGTLAQWSSFLAGSMPGTPATVLRGASFKQQPDMVSLSVDGIKADWPASAVPLDKQTELAVEPGWTMESDKAELHVRRVVLSEPESPNPMIVLNRYERAFDDSPQTAISFWHDLTTHAHPYDGQLIDRDDRRFMIHVFDPASPDTARHAYALTYSLKDKTPEADVLAHLTAAQKTTALP